MDSSARDTWDVTWAFNKKEQVLSSTSWGPGTFLPKEYSYGMLLSSAGRLKALDRRLDLNCGRINSIPQGWFGQLPTSLSVKVCVCHQPGTEQKEQGKSWQPRVCQREGLGLCSRAGLAHSWDAGSVHAPCPQAGSGECCGFAKLWTTMCEAEEGPVRPPFISLFIPVPSPKFCPPSSLRQAVGFAKYGVTSPACCT